MLLLMTLNLDTIFDERKYADDLIDAWMIWDLDGEIQDCRSFGFELSLKILGDDLTFR